MGQPQQHIHVHVTHVHVVNTFFDTLCLGHMLSHAIRACLVQVAPPTPMVDVGLLGGGIVRAHWMHGKDAS